MTPLERDRLRAAWLAGALNPEERREFLEAAAGDQALFDELMDAEPLRDLLAEPDTRAEALRRLRPAAAEARVPWWRQRWSWAGAGALAMATVMFFALLPPRRVADEPPAQLAAARPAPAPESPPPALAAVPERKTPKPADLSVAASKPRAADEKRLAANKTNTAMDELRAAAPVFDAPREKEMKDERTEERDRRPGTGGGVVGGVVGGVPGGVLGGIVRSAPPPPAPAAEPVFRAAETAASQSPAPQPQAERFGQRAPAGPMQQTQANQSVVDTRDRIEVQAAKPAAGQDLSKTAGAAPPAPVKAAFGLRQSDGAIQQLPPGEPVERGARLVLSIEAAAPARVRIGGLPDRTPPARALAAGERWVLDLPTAESGPRTVLVLLDPPVPGPTGSFAAFSRSAAPISLTYRVR